MNNDDSEPMDASLLQLERELLSLTPAAPGPDLLSALQARLEPVATRHAAPPQANRLQSMPWRRVVAPAAAAAAVAVMTVQSHRRATAGSNGLAVEKENTAPTIKWEPMPMKREYRAWLDAGYALNDNMEPVRQMLMNTVDQHEWRSAAGNSSVRLIIPRQQRVPLLQPATFETPVRKRWQFQ